jgi:RNA polymerase sigma-70 factor (ECF subfamily)
MASSTKTKPTLLKRIQDGRDALAWRDFFDRYWRLIYALAKHRGSSDHTAEEIVQDVMVAVFEKRDVFRYDVHRGRFRDWLGALVRNKLADHRRRPSQRIRARGGDADQQSVEIEDAANGPDAAWDAAFEDALLAALLDLVRKEMNPRTYQAFELFALHGLPGAKVAEATGLTANAVYQARKNVVKRLVELGASYRDEGQLDDRIKHALQFQPSAAVERSITDRVTASMVAGESDG